MSVPLITVGDRDHPWWTERAQWFLAGRNRWRYNAGPGQIDGQAGARFGRACQRAKWYLGYPLDACKPFYGPGLHGLLSLRFFHNEDGTTKRNDDYRPLPRRYMLRKLARIGRRNPFPEPLPAHPWPFKSRQIGRLNGCPYQGTHTLGNWESDNAIDLNVPVGTPVIAVWDGIIGNQWGPISANDPHLFGNRIHIMRADGVDSYYAHLIRLIARPGHHVRRGDVIGLSGSAAGVAHLHFSVMPRSVHPHGMRPQDLLGIRGCG